MPHIEVQPNGQIDFVHSKSKTKPANKPHHVDARDRTIADLQRRLNEVEEQKEQLIVQYQNLSKTKQAVVEDAKDLKHAAIKYKKDSEETEDRYEDLQTRYERKGEEIKQKDKVIRQRENEIRSKDKELEDYRVDKKVQSGTIKLLEERNAALQDRVTTVSDEKRRLQQEVALRRANEEKLVAEKNNLKDENARLLGWVESERRLALEREARRDNDRRAPPPRRRFEDDFF